MRARYSAGRIGLPQTKHDFVVQSLRDSIIRGEIKPGEWIRPDDWAQRLGVSQTPIREALRQLEAHGLVSISAHRGAQVRGYSMREFADLLRIRAALESLAVELAIERIPEEDLDSFIAELHELADEMVELAKVEEYDVVREVNHDLHFRIYDASDSERLVNLIESIWTSFPFDFGHLMPGTQEGISLEHYAILDAMKQRDPKAAGAAMHQHIEKIGQLRQPAVRQLPIFSADGRQDQRKRSKARATRASHPTPSRTSNSR